MKTARTLLFLAAASLAPACDDSDTSAPVNATGRYQLSLTTASNGCQFEGDFWQEGRPAQGIALIVNQDPNDRTRLTGKVEGVAGGLLSLWLGSDTFEGTLRGTAIDLALMGRRAMSSRSCAYTTNAQINATLKGDVLEGTIVYRYATNNTPDCGFRSTCQTVQNFNGTRPPSM